jgi:anaerobic magnesium-protoporphyrin IX monomethyl ester cyclase
VRIRSAEKIMEELRTLKKLGVTNFGFHCDTFTLDKKMVIDLCKMILAENLKMKWAANSRVDTVDEETLLWMKKAGCWMVAYGIESGSQVVLNNVKKGITLEQIENTIRVSHKAGIKNWGYFVMGLPGETEETIKETIAFAKKLPLDYVNFAVGTPYPGTDFYEEALRERWLKGEPWEGFDQNYAALVEYPNMPAQKILKGIKKAYFSWYTRPSVILKMLTDSNNWKHLWTLMRVGLLHLFWKPE